MARYTLAELIKDFTGNYLDPTAPFNILANVVSNQIFALVVGTVRPALTTDVYNKFKCILYCHMNGAAFFTGAAWEAVRSDILSKIPGVAGVFLEHIVYLLGNGGLSNLARGGGASTGNCDDCTDCPEACNADGWINGIWYQGADINNRGGVIVDRGADYIVLRSTDRGDGNSEMALYPMNHTDQCAIFWQFVEPDLVTPGGNPPNIYKWYNPPPLSASYELQVRNDLLVSPVTASMLYFQMNNAVFYCRFTFI
jgi:hypothetical protein